MGIISIVGNKSFFFPNKSYFLKTTNVYIYYIYAFIHCALELKQIHDMHAPKNKLFFVKIDDTH